MKEMKEERELLMRKLQKSNQYEAMMVTEDYEPMAAGFFFHFLPPRSPPAPVSLWSDSDLQSEQSSMDSKNTPVLMSLNFAHKDAYLLSNNFLCFPFRP
ncbi:hypothetical protein SLEP1_g58976 [Rubroshorea leprosula]|uniref:Uncharacterized protein n=1 Tax=Rubroshorea leprosula TaxID=152421 RepID=A0AAV5MR38_9ROSI|nr:hypothetical protein SLEP1_g58976 [Rubroshorea leprosula]